MQQEKILLRQLSLQEYIPVSQAMYKFTDRRTDNTLDEIWLVQHYPIFTQGYSGKQENILVKGNIPIIRSDRGGQITYHGPGQQIMYVLIDLKRHKFSARQLICYIEQTVINTLSKFFIKGYTRSYAPGVYVDGQKICSLGLRIHKGCVFHGMALNISMDLSPFSYINPCGYSGIKMTQISAINPDIKPEKVRSVLVVQLMKILKYKELELCNWNPQDYE
ncbi:lipoyl(octanoyl) transferase LipB [Candidatus Profftia sp. (ex Adelges kitamiensis)]|uniref:lipoyl(octanoyl) transferase LipB n=1 Tax=Candidatus Profftia sp. (ex Adelges kitamiensis) TaxID=2864218 RepID=UPI001CE25C58|nr:lipoyl(octanoyl) transferase LipB [Candidatus Profftia sp. (ex Adelges kitamiensis)]